DDPSMYHLFYGDQNGTPGSELTFFEMPMAAHTRRGTNAITRIGLFVRGESSLSYWQKRFDEHGVEYSESANYGGRKSLLFEDGDGLRLALRQQIMRKSANSRAGTGPLCRKNIRL